MLYSIACVEGEYKFVQGNEECIECPANSNSTGPGATSCECISGYYRTSSENSTIQCTGKTKIKELIKKLLICTVLYCTGITVSGYCPVCIMLCGMMHIHIHQRNAKLTFVFTIVVLCIL